MFHERWFTALHICMLLHLLDFARARWERLALARIAATFSWEQFWDWIELTRARQSANLLFFWLVWFIGCASMLLRCVCVSSRASSRLQFLFSILDTDDGTTVSTHLMVRLKHYLFLTKVTFSTTLKLSKTHHFDEYLQSS